jgi:hypothetical protein
VTEPLGFSMMPLENRHDVLVRWREAGAELPVLLLPPQLEAAQIDFVLSALA